MLTINLEKELLNSNVSLIETKDSLLIDEYNKQKELDTSILNRVGLNNVLTVGSRIENKINLNELQIEKFDRTKVFNIKQIEKICDKYYLKFLPTKFYNGSIDSELPNKISEFETTYSVTCYSDKSFILAPRNSFQLEEKPKDPLFFYKINDEYYYLIHKWGNDLSILNRFKSILSKKITTIVFYLFMLFCVNCIFKSTYIENKIIFNGLYIIISFFVNLIYYFENDRIFTFYKENNPFSQYIE